MENWIADKQRKIVEMQKENKDSEDKAISFYSLYMLRLLTGLAQMNTSQFYIYEKKILWHAMKLFCDYYIEEIQEASKTTDPEKKLELLDDIENAITKISDVYKNLVDSTSNSDRQMFTSLSVDTNMYELSPKLLAFYSAALETLVEIFQQKEFYAFLLHPSLKRDIETVSLFEKRDKKGKVVLIFLPEKRIENQNEIWIYLLHEAYHVLSRELRHRKYRVVTFEKNMVCGISQMLFHKVQFSEDEETDYRIRESLMRRWFTLTDELEEFNSYPEDDRRLYGRFVVEKRCASWRKCLVTINNTLGNDIINVMVEFADDDQSDPAKIYETCEHIDTRLRTNIFTILAEDRISQIADQYMLVYREIYADIACVLTMGVEPQLYERAFKNAVLFSEYREKDLLREFRMLIVAKGIANLEDVAYNKWKAYAEEKEMDFFSCRASRDSPGMHGNDKILPMISDQDLKSYCSYAERCVTDFYDFIKGKEGILQFQEVIKGSSLTDILSGISDKKLDGIITKNEKEN